MQVMVKGSGGYRSTSRGRNIKSLVPKWSGVRRRRVSAAVAEEEIVYESDGGL